ncbi:MAG: ribonuclease Y [Myxococcales bacterium]|nr:MAG: ribonuclease Y [Myxococcales bacterium]
MSIVIAIVTLFVGAAVGYFVHRAIQANRLGAVKDVVANLKREAELEADRLVKEAELKAKEIEIQTRREVEKELRQRKEEAATLEKHLFQKEETIAKKTAYLDQKEEEQRKKEGKLDAAQKSLEEKQEKLDGLIQDQIHVLERTAGLSAEEAKKQLMDAMVEEAKHEAAKHIKQVEDEAHEMAEKKAKNIIALAIQRYAGDYVTEKAVSVVGLPNDEMKGRIIGREGRNIRALEAATGVDLIIDDTPEAVVLSAFDPVRREVARMALETLIQDGRIHPARIEEIVAKCEKDLESQMKDFGQQAAFDLGLHGLHPEIIKLLGRLRYRTSYGQNVWSHSIEVAYISGMMAAELGLPVKAARRAGLLHDIGKALTHEVEGSHAVIGANIAKKYGEQPKIINAIASHHEDEQPESILAVLVAAADALSGARPGARREILESYVKRLTDLEAIATSFKGVEKAYAIQAGREVRVIVASEQVNDDESVVLAKDVAKRIEDEMTYPGQIKVVVIRETRAMSIAN